MAMGDNLVPPNCSTSEVAPARYRKQSSSKITHMTHTFTMTRTYETIIEVEADNYEDAIKQLYQIDVYAIELEQCCVTEEVIKDDNGLVINNQ